MLADNILESCTYGSEEYEKWRGIWERLSSLYRFAFFVEAPQPGTLPDFYWPKHKNRQVEDFGWRPMDEHEAKSLLSKNTDDPMQRPSPDWWGPCNY